MKKIFTLLPAILITTVVNAQWINTENGIQYNQGNISIGDVSPSSNDKILVYGGDISIHQGNSDENGLIWKNWSYQKNSAAIKPVDMGTWARMGIGFFTGDFYDRTTNSVERMRITRTGNVGIGTTTPDHKLDVVGTIRAHQVLVNTQKGADFVFEDGYNLRPLEEVEQFVAENKHLPDIAPAASMVRDGVDMCELQLQLLQKIEELTLYVIQQQKQLDQQKVAYEAQLAALRQEVEKLTATQK